MIGKKRSKQNQKKQYEELDSEVEEGSVEDELFVTNDAPKISADRVKLEMANKLIEKLKDNDEMDTLVTKKKSDGNKNDLKPIPSITLEETAFLKCHTNSLTSCTFSPDGTKLYSVAKDGYFIATDLVKTSKTAHKISPRALYSLVQLNETTFFTAGKDRQIYSFDIRDKLPRAYKAHSDAITGLALDPSGEYLYSTSNDLTLKVWALNQSTPVFTENFWGHTSAIFSMDVLEQNRIVSCGQDRKICLWKVDSQSFLNYEYSDAFSFDVVRSISKTKFITGTSDGDVLLWNASKKKPLSKLTAVNGFSNGLPVNMSALACIKGTNVFFAGSTGGHLNVMSIDEKNEITKGASFLTGGIVNDLAFSESGKLLAAALGKDNRLGRWQTCNSKQGIRLYKVIY